jgi:hypothetical protein
VALLAFEIGAEQQVVRHARQARDAAVARVERGLDGGEREGAALGHFERKGARLVPQPLVRHDLVDQPHVQRLAGRDLRVAEPDVLGALLADQVLEIPGAVAGVERAHHRPDLAEHGAFLGDREVADHLQHVAAADREAVDAGDHGLLQPLDRLVHVEGRQDAGVEARVLHALLTAADAEEAVASPGYDKNAGARLAPDPVDAVAHLMAHHGGEHVAVIGPVQGQGPDRAILLIEDRLVAHAACPFAGSQLRAC